MINNVPLWDAETELRVRSAEYVLDLQDVPTEVRFCRRCVVSNQRPRIVFDGEGVCSACRFYESLPSVDWKAREEQLVSLLDRHRRPKGYDVIVPCSGGKDSAMVAHRLKTEWGMKPLCVTWAPFAYTDIGRKNFESFVHAGFDCIVAYPDGLTHRKLSRLALEFTGDAWAPFAFGQIAYPMNMAEKFGIPLVMGGENGEAYYGGDASANSKPCWSFEDWERVYLKGAGVDKIVEAGRGLGIELEPSDFYRLPDNRDGLEYHWWSYYKGWRPQTNFYWASEHTGFEANPDGRSEGTYSRYASLDDRFDGFHYYLAYIKFGIGRCTSDAAHEVRDGEITREEAVALVKRYDGEFPSKHFPEFLAYLGIDEAHWASIVDRYRRPHIWRRDGCGWALRHKVWDDQAAIDRAA